MFLINVFPYKKHEDNVLHATGATLSELSIPENGCDKGRPLKIRPQVLSRHIKGALIEFWLELARKTFFAYYA